MKIGEGKRIESNGLLREMRGDDEREPETKCLCCVPSDREKYKNRVEKLGLV